jgi:hypothetical protein
VRKLLAIALFLLSAETSIWPCTIVSGTGANGVVWAGNNEDEYFDFETYLNVLPPDKGKFGAIFFSYDGPANFPQGGMNEKGLFFDLNAIPHVPRADYRDYGKRKTFPGGDTALLLHMLRTCSTVNDVLALLDRYRFDDLFDEQLHLADRTGALAVVTAQSVVRPEHQTFQVSTNFNLATERDAPEGQSCWRFPIANRILGSQGVSMESIRSTLDATQQPRVTSTIYSNIMNLNTREMYLYYAGDFENARHYTWAELMELTPKSILMRELFPNAPIVRMQEIAKAQGVSAALKLFRELRSGVPEHRRAEVLRHLFLNALFKTYQYSDAQAYFNEWVSETAGTDALRYQGLVKLANGDVKGARSSFEELAQSAASDGSSDRAGKSLERLSGVPSPESNVTLELSGFREARFVAVDGITEAATFSFLVRTATGWRGDFHVAPGKLRYAFIVDGKRILDPANPSQEDKWDQDGTRRFSVRLIPEPSVGRLR